MHIFRATRVGGLHVSSTLWLRMGGGGHKIFDHQIGGSQNIAEVLSEIHDPPIPKKMVAPLSLWKTGSKLDNTKLIMIKFDKHI